MVLLLGNLLGVPRWMSTCRVQSDSMQENHMLIALGKVVGGGGERLGGGRGGRRL